MESYNIDILNRAHELKTKIQTPLDQAVPRMNRIIGILMKEFNISKEEATEYFYE